jgi:importin-4
LNREYYDKPSCIPALASIIASAPEDAVRASCFAPVVYFLTSLQVRQLAAVELRKRATDSSGDLWLQLPQNEREQIKAKLPDLVLGDPKSAPRFSITWFPLMKVFQ